jgi:hypothetical protein
VALNTGRPWTYSTIRDAAAASAWSTRRNPLPDIRCTRRTNGTASGVTTARVSPSRQSTTRNTAISTTGTVTICRNTSATAETPSPAFTALPPTTVVRSPVARRSSSRSGMRRSRSPSRSRIDSITRAHSVYWKPISRHRNTASTA